MKLNDTMTLYANVYYCDHHNTHEYLKYEVMLPKQKPRYAALAIIEYFNDFSICKKVDDCKITVFDKNGKKIMPFQSNTPYKDCNSVDISEKTIDKFPFEL